MRKETHQNSAAEPSKASLSAAHLLHPAMHFDHPRDVLMANNISKEEKRAILASWASDMSAIESMPAWRRLPGVDRIVSYDEILAALKALDDAGQCSLEQSLTASFNVNKIRRRRPEFGMCSYGKGGRRRQQFEI